MTTQEYLLLGPIGILFLISIREFFAYLKAKKNGDNTIDYGKELASINLQLSNHITSFSEDLREVRNDIKTIKEAIIDIKISISKK